MRSSAPCMGRQQQQQWTERKKKRDMERVDERAREGGMVKKRKEKKVLDKEMGSGIETKLEENKGVCVMTTTKETSIS